MAFPTPAPGLVIRYAYLWRREALAGRAEGAKDRPCVVILALKREAGWTVVTVAPTTHSPPNAPATAIEIPPATKRRLGLDGERSWIVVADLNQFIWPGPDLRPTHQGSETFAYGLLPAALYREVRDGVLNLARKGAAAVSRRDG